MNFIVRALDAGAAVSAKQFWIRSFAIPRNMANQRPFDPDLTSLQSRSKSTLVSPFEWSIGPDATPYVTFHKATDGVAVQINPGAPGRTVLLEQTLVLPPSRYEISSIVEGQVRQSPAEWQIYCTQMSSPLIRTFKHSGQVLSDIEFTVPGQNCDSQRLVLAARQRTNSQPISISRVTLR